MDNFKERKLQEFAIIARDYVYALEFERQFNDPCFVVESAVAMERFFEQIYNKGYEDATRDFRD